MNVCAVYAGFLSHVFLFLFSLPQAGVFVSKSSLQIIKIKFLYHLTFLLFLSTLVWLVNERVSDSKNEICKILVLEIELRMKIVVAKVLLKANLLLKAVTSVECHFSSTHCMMVYVAVAQLLMIS